MRLSLKESNAVQALAQAVQDFLPGSGARQWKGHITFGSVAHRVGVGDFWATSGSKVPRLVRLFEQTLELRRGCFESLVVGVVKEGLRYRSGQGRRITSSEIEVINGLLLDVGFKFPDLWDPELVGALATDDISRVQAKVAAVRSAEVERSSVKHRERTALATLRVEFEGLFADENRQRVGFRLESILNRLFELSSLAPREPFRVVGEQIDGSFVLDHEVYLLEAKWEKHPLPEADLLVFRGKIEGKSSFTRGVFVAMNGISTDAGIAIRTGKQPSFFVINGHDIMMILQGAMPLDAFLRARFRILAEEGAVVAMFDRLSSR